MTARMVEPSDVEHAARCSIAWHFHQQDPDHDSGDSGAAGRRVGALLTQVRNRREPGIGFWLPLMVGSAAIATTIAGLMLGSRDTAGYVIIATSLVLLQSSAAILTLHLIDVRRERKLRETMGTIPQELDGNFPWSDGPVVDDQWGLQGQIGTVVHGGDKPIPVVVADGPGPREVDPWMAMRVGASMRLLEVRDGQAPPYGLVAYSDGAFRVSYDEVRTPLRVLLDGLSNSAPPKLRDHDERRRCKTCPWQEPCSKAIT